MMEEANVDFVLTEMQFESKVQDYKQIYSDCSICTAAPGSKERLYTQAPRSRLHTVYIGTTGRPKAFP